MSDAAALLKALADPVRLRLVALVAREDLSQAELVSLLGLSQPRLARHLKILVEAGFFEARREGSWVFYRLRGEGLGPRAVEGLRFLFEGSPFDADAAAQAASRDLRRAQRRGFFDTVAGRYDVLRAEVLAGFDLEAALAELLPARMAVAADLGCGTGAMLPFLAARAETVIAVDASLAMLDVAAKALGKTPASRLSLRRGELERLPVADAEADAAALSLVLHHLDAPVRGLAEAARILKPGGTLVVAEWAAHTDESFRERFGDRRLGFSRQELLAAFAAAGLEAKSLEERRLASGVGLFLCALTRRDNR